MRWAILAAFVFALLVGAWFGWEGRELRHASPIRRELAERALAREVAEAERLGFVAASASTLPAEAPMWTTSSRPTNHGTLTLREGECVAVVAAGFGWGRLDDLALRDVAALSGEACPYATTHRAETDRSARSRATIEGVVGHVQFCAWEPVELRLCIDSERLLDPGEPDTSGPPRVLLRELRAFGLGADALTRGYVTTGPPEPSEPEAPREGSDRAGPSGSSAAD